jgi:hypothetical protein
MVAGLIKAAVKVTRGGKTFEQMRWVRPPDAAKATRAASAPAAKAAEAPVVKSAETLRSQAAPSKAGKAHVDRIAATSATAERGATKASVGSRLDRALSRLERMPHQSGRSTADNAVRISRHADKLHRLGMRVADRVEGKGVTKEVAQRVAADVKPTRIRGRGGKKGSAETIREAVQRRVYDIQAGQMSRRATPW